MESHRRGEVWWPPGAPSEEPPERLPAIDVIIPALNESDALPKVLSAIPDRWVRRVVVVDNGSVDDTADVAREGGAVVVTEARRGYGSACLCGISAVAHHPPAIVVFLDADYSDYPEELPRLVQPLLGGEIDLVIGSRTLGRRQAGAMLPQAIIGNAIACAAMDVMYGYHFSDLGPFRAITWQALQALGMGDRDFGWTVEMQARAARQGLAAVEVPVSYRRRVGTSKITGTLGGTIKAGYKILYTLGREYLKSQQE